MMMKSLKSYNGMRNRGGRAIGRANLVLGAAVAAAAISLAPNHASAATTLYWDPSTTGTGTWLTGNVWNTVQTNTPADLTGWGSGDQAFFSNANVTTGSVYVVTLGSVSADSVVFNSTAPINFSGGTLTLSGTAGLTMNSGAGAVNIQSAVALGNGQTWNTSASTSNSLTVSGIISGSQNLAIYSNGNTTITGGGTGAATVLSNANTFIGTLTIDSGLIAPTTDAGLGNSANSIIINSGGLLDQNQSSGVTIGSGRTITLNNATSFFRAYGSGDFIIASKLTGSGGPEIIDGGTVEFSNAGNNYLGNTTIGDGILKIDTAGALPSGTTVAFVNTTNTAGLTLTGLNQTIANMTFGTQTTGTNTITITGNSSSGLTVSPSALTFTATNATTSALTFTMASVGSFTYSNTSGSLNVQTGNLVTSGFTTVTLAGTTDNITASSLGVGDGGAGGAGTTEPLSTLNLGATTTIDANSIGIGNSGSRGGGKLVAGSGVLTIAGTSGGGSTSNLTIGKSDSYEVSDVNNCTFDSSAGTLDALFGSITMGQDSAGGTTGRGITINSTLKMGAGSLSANSLNIGNFSGAYNAGSYVITSLLDLEGAGTASIGTITFGNNTATLAAPSVVPSLTLNSQVTINAGATLDSTTIAKGGTGVGSGTRTDQINFENGTIGNITGANLSISGVNIVLSGTGNTHAFNISSGQFGSIVSNISTATGNTSAGIVANGAGTLILSGTDSQGYTTIAGGGTLAANSATALGATGATFSFGNAPNGTQEGFQGLLEFNTAPTNTCPVSFGTRYGDQGTIQANYSNPAITFGALTFSQNNTLNFSAGSGSTGNTPTMTFPGTGNTFGAVNNTTSDTLNPVGVSVAIGAMAPIALTSAGTFTQTLNLGGTSINNSLGAVSNYVGGTNTSLGAITKSNTSVWSLLGANTYTGPTNVNAGTLILDHTNGTGSLGNTAVSIAGGATLLVKGTTTIANTGPTMNVAGGASTSAQGTLSLADGTINMLNLSGNLALGTSSNGAILDLDLGTVSGSSDELNVTGSVATTGVTTINFSGTTVAVGTYNLIQTGVASFTAGNMNAATGFVVGSHPAGFYNYSLSDASTTLLQLIVSGATAPSVAYWTGAASQTGGDSLNNWGYGSTLSTPQTNWSSDQPGLDDTLQVPGSTTAVYFTANNAVSNSGALSTQLDNNYSIASLTFDTSQANSTINSVAINTNGNTLTLGSGGLTITATDNSSTLITGSGTGILVGASQAWENNNNSVPLNISTGIAGTAVGSSSVYTLSLNGSGTGGVYLSGPITDGTAGGTLAIYFAQSGVTTLAGNNNFSGGAFLASGTLDLASSLAIESSTLDMAGGTLTFDASVPSNAFTLGGLTDIGGIVLQNTAAAPITLTVGVNNASTTYGGVLSGPGNLVKAGTGTLTLTASSTYLGTTNISSGTLQLGVGGSLPSTTTLGFTATGTFDLNSQLQSVAGVTVVPGGNGTIINGALATNTITFTASAASSSTLSNGSGGSINGGGSPILINSSAAGGTSVVAGVEQYLGVQLSGTGGIVIQAYGNVSDNGGSNNSLFELTNPNNNFTGGVNVSTGLVDVSDGDGIFNNATNASTNVISIAPNAGLIAPTSVTLNSSSIVLNGAGNHYLRAYGPGTATLTINGNISGTTASSGLYVVDAGTIVLTGSNSYLGTTTANDGTVTVTGNESAATGGWTIGRLSQYAVTVNFNASSVINVASTGAVSVGALPGGSDSGTPPGQILNVYSTAGVTNAGVLGIGRNATVNIDNGGLWIQTGPLNVEPIAASGYGAVLAVNTGGTFIYNNGSTAINLTPSPSNAGTGEILLAGGTFDTNQGILNGETSGGSNGEALLSLTGGGTLVLSANVPSLVNTNGSTFAVTLGNNSGGVFNTNGFNTSINSPLTNVSANAGVLNKTGLGSLTLGAANNYSGGTNVSAGSLVFAAPGALPNFTRLTVGAGALAQAQFNTGTKNSLFVSALNIAGSTGNWTGALDLSNNDMVVRNGSLGTLTNQVALGYGGGSWTGTGGIMSSAAANDSTHLTALGVVQNTTGSATLYGSFDGQAALISDVLVKYTYYGDANLDGQVDGSDYSLVDNTYFNENLVNGVAMNPLSGWYNGDFNYDNVVDGSDYTLMDNSYNMQGSQIAAQIASPTALVGAGSAVPEPASLALLGIGAVGLLGRRSARRHRGAR